LINRFHGFWSLGAFAGSLLAGAAAYLGTAPLTQFTTTGVVIAVASAWFLSNLPGRADRAVDPSLSPGAVAVTGALFALIAMSFAGVIAEGGTSDWSAIFLRELSHAGPGVAAAGFSGFTIAATLVRFRADQLTARTSRATVARAGAVIAVGGLALAIASPAIPTAIVGFSLVGMGTAVVLPLTFAAGANLGRTGTALALVMAATYAGTIAGPPLIGAAADHFGLRVAMGIPLGAAVAVVLLAGNLGMRAPVTPGRR
jgi:MFS family permease